MSAAPSPAPDTGTILQAKLPFLRRVRIRGYKSLAFCDVALEPLTILVGRNASGKSNFLDALAFLRDATSYNLTVAINRRGGMGNLLCRATDAKQFSIEVESIHHQERSGQDDLLEHKVAISYRPDEWAYHAQEWFRMTRLSDGQVLKETSHDSADHLTLTASGYPEAAPLVHGCQRMGFYNFSPEAMRQPQKPTQGELLERDGRNLASVLESTRAKDPWAVERVARNLLAITRSVEFARVGQVGGYETLCFRVLRNGQGNPIELSAANMSDGTLRAFAALVAAFQQVQPFGSPSLVGIEEPETSLHPAAMRALVGALDEATLRTQIVLTTHSAEMLDNPLIRPENVRVVQMVDGRTVIGPVDEASVEILREKLDTLGGLERQNQLEPDYDDQDRQSHLARSGQESHG